jgi:speckle-type POZ protein
LYSVSVTIEETIFGEEMMDAFEKSCLISIWLKGRLAKEKYVPLQKITSLKWNLELKADSLRKFFTLYLDFGTNTKSTRKIIEGFGKMFYNQNLCDVDFTFNDGQTIGAHVNVLSAGSPIFAAMFQLDMLESKTRHVVITDFELNVFRQLLILRETLLN